MTKEVLISISGVQFMDQEGQDVEMITKGTYYEKNGKHYILYDEVLEGEGEVIRNTIKIMPDAMDIIKKGSASTHMVFERNKKNLTCYVTPVGELMVGISTNQIRLLEEENLLEVQVEYSLDINYQYVSDCELKIEVKGQKE